MGRMYGCEVLGSPGFSVMSGEYKMARSTGMQCSRCAQFSLREIDRKQTAQGLKVIFHCGKCNKNETMGA